MFEKQDVTLSMKIINKLLEKSELNENDFQLLNNYFSNENVRDIIDIFCEENQLFLHKGIYEDYICVVPKKIRSNFSYNKKEFNDKYNLNKKSALNFMFITFCIFTIYNDLNQDDFQIEIIQKFADDKIEKIKEDLQNENINDKYNWNFDLIVNSWDSLKEITNIDTKNVRAGEGSKESFIKKSLKILENEKIIEFYEKEINAIKIKEKTRAIINSLAEDDNYNVLKSYFGSVKDA